MSCGQPHAVDCQTILAHVYEFLDGEVAAEERILIVQHLEECPPCLGQYGVERDVQALVQRSCACDHAPETLRVQIVARIRQVSITYRSSSD